MVGVHKPKYIIVHVCTWCRIGAEIMTLSVVCSVYVVQGANVRINRKKRFFFPSLFLEYICSAFIQLLASTFLRLLHLYSITLTPAALVLSSLSFPPVCTNINKNKFFNFSFIHFPTRTIH